MKIILFRLKQGQGFIKKSIVLNLFPHRGNKSPSCLHRSISLLVKWNQISSPPITQSIWTSPRAKISIHLRQPAPINDRLFIFTAHSISSRYMLRKKSYYVAGALCKSPSVRPRAKSALCSESTL
jgi:hypothetical protein